MGSASSECSLELIKQLGSEKWEEIVPVTALRPGYEDTRMNYQKVGLYLGLSLRHAVHCGRESNTIKCKIPGSIKRCNT